jgi:hypothetical protein
METLGAVPDSRHYVERVPDEPIDAIACRAPVA